MLEILYDKATKEVRAWNAADKVQGNLKPKEGQEVIIFPISPPSFGSGEYKVEEANQTIVDGNPSYKPKPPRSSHISVLTAVDAAKARPAQIKRVWEGRDYFYDCFATQTVKDEFVAGKIAIGDYVIVHFDDIGEQIVTAKVFKSWV